MRTSFLPATDPGLLAWSKNFSERLLENAGSFGVSLAQAEAYAARHEAFATWESRRV